MKKILVSLLMMFSTLAHAELYEGSTILVGYRPPYAQEILYVKDIAKNYYVLLNWLRDDTGGPLYLQYVDISSTPFTKNSVEKFELQTRGMQDEHTKRYYDLYFNQTTAVRFYKDLPRTIMITPREWITLRKGWAETWMGTK